MNAAARSRRTAASQGQQLQGLQLHGLHLQPLDLQVHGLQAHPLFSVFSMGLLLFARDVDSPCANRL